MSEATDRRERVKTADFKAELILSEKLDKNMWRNFCFSFYLLNENNLTT